MYGIIPPANKDIMTSSFPIYIHFISISDFIDMTSNLVLSKSGENGLSRLISDYSKCTFSFITMLIIGLSHTVFIMFKEKGERRGAEHDRPSSLSWHWVFRKGRTSTKGRKIVGVSSVNAVSSAF